MPHCIIEIAPELRREQKEARKFLHRLHERIALIGPFNVDGIKSRIMCADASRASCSLEDKLFVHCQVAIMEGRDYDTKKALLHGIHQFLVEEFNEILEGRPCTISVDLRELTRNFYSQIEL